MSDGEHSTDARTAASVSAQPLMPCFPQIREQVREEYRTGAVPSGSNPPPVTIHTWLERFNKQKPRSFEKAVAPVDAENWISHMEKIFDVMDCRDSGSLYVDCAAFKKLFSSSVFPIERNKSALKRRVNHSSAKGRCENSTEYNAVVGCWQRNLEILRDRDDYDRSERSDKRHKSGDRYQSATQQNNYRSHDQKLRSGNLYWQAVVLLYDMNLTSRHGNRNSGAGRGPRNRGPAIPEPIYQRSGKII
ncbi:hypothetical protein Tco_1476608 [Tanacetum coccineum]